MRLFQLLERKVPRIMFHGTRAEHARSILKHGLIPNRSVVDAGLEWISLEGVYFTDQIDKAIRSAEAANDYNERKKILVIAARIVTQSGIPDEDKLHSLITAAWRNLIPRMGGEYVEEVNHPYEAFEEPPSEEIQRKITRAIADRVHDQTGSTRSIPYALFRQYIDEMPTMSGDFMWDNYTEAKDKLIRYYRSAPRMLDAGYSAHDVRITRPVTFRGRNAILAMATPSERGWDYLYDRSSGTERAQIHTAMPPGS